MADRRVDVFRAQPTVSATLRAGSVMLCTARAVTSPPRIVRDGDEVGSVAVAAQVHVEHRPGAVRPPGSRTTAAAPMTRARSQAPAVIIEAEPDRAQW
ncbi:hypothetical protein [Streptomyces sp. NPDC007205]|uniref:hypothetical protein n=1 Tax=Streptomyces sp. NPDC007205 TaxID=3154316 RepID=UPI0033CCD4BA